ncbi:hypothetical protein TNCV_1508461 [Trichonephila clavipes]|nr:hypothetical protein TNCV_1508461 [Trichonephila clavipes]
MVLVILNHDQVTRMTPELTSPFQTSTFANRKTLSLDKFNEYQLTAILQRHLEPSTAEDLPCRGEKHVKSVESSNVLLLVWYDS